MREYNYETAKIGPGLRLSARLQCINDHYQNMRAAEPLHVSIREITVILSHNGMTSTKNRAYKS